MSESRITLIKKLLKTNKLQYILLTDSTTARYVSGLSSSYIFLLISARKNLLFTDFRYRNVAQNLCKKQPHWQFVEIDSSVFKLISKYIKKNSRVGIQSDKMTLDLFDTMKKHIKNSTFIKLGQKLSKLPSIKTKTEIASMHRAAKIGDKAIGKLIEYIKIGMTEKQIACELELLCKKFGSEKPSFDTIVLFGLRAALPHGRPSNKKLRSGDWILIDFGCTVNDFYSDMTRTFVMGKANNKQKHFYSIVQKAQEKAKKIVSPGIKACDIDIEGRSFIEDAGYGKAFGHGIGHGLGIEIHELPSVSKKDSTILQPGMIVTVEPGIYVNDFGGVRIEDMMLITQNGSKSLTKTPRNLIEIDI